MLQNQPMPGKIRAHPIQRLVGQRVRSGRRPSRFCASALILITLAGCATPPRHRVPNDLVARAQVIGFPGVRDFGDSFSPTLQASLVESIRQSRLPGSNQGVDDSGPREILALSGGGADGAFGAGLLCGWSAAGTRPTFALVTGISTGALIAPFAFVGSGADAALKRVYTTISTKDIYREKSMLEALISGDSLLDNRAMVELIAREVDEAMLSAIAGAHRRGRRLFVGTTNMDTGTFVIWDMGAIAASGRSDALDLFRAVMRASSAIPLAFPLVRFSVEADGQAFDEMHSDGGVTAQVFLNGFALELRQAEHEVGAAPRPARLYVIRNGQIASSWNLILQKNAGPPALTTKGLIGAAILGDLYRIYTIAGRQGIDFNLACIPGDYVPAARESFDRIEMNRLFDLAFEAARTGYRWKQLPPGLRATPVESAHAR